MQACNLLLLPRAIEPKVNLSIDSISTSNNSKSFSLSFPHGGFAFPNVHSKFHSLRTYSNFHFISFYSNHYGLMNDLSRNNKTNLLTSNCSRRVSSPVTKAIKENSRENLADDQVKSKPNNLNEINYEMNFTDHILLKLFRNKMSQEVGWDSKQADYEGLIEISRKLISKYNDKKETEKATVRILNSLFPSGLLPLFRILILPISQGKVATVLTAWVTKYSCQWLMGKCMIEEVAMVDGSSLPSGVHVERCKYLEAAGCVGVCVHTCKMPTQQFIKSYMGIPLEMEPNFEDYSCKFKFGIEPVPEKEKEILLTPCLSKCITKLSPSLSPSPSLSLSPPPPCPQVSA